MPDCLGADTKHIFNLAFLTGSEWMTAMLRLSMCIFILAALMACSVQPVETSLTSSMQVSSTAGRETTRPKTLSSDILSEIALERVTGRRSGNTNFNAWSAR